MANLLRIWTFEDSSMSALCTVPVTLAESRGGFAADVGARWFDGQSLVIEFQIEERPARRSSAPRATS